MMMATTMFMKMMTTIGIVTCMKRMENIELMKLGSNENYLWINQKKTLINRKLYLKT